ncbi:MAG: methyltransferase domain-containing protein, partial [Anaerolineae bacterium]|nr:methyltransferase domain-containing protein [Anaerolineae bacterium]
YLYPHAYRDHWVAQQYLPDALQGRVFYQPSDQGYEARIREEVARRREAQLAAMIDGGALALPEVLTFTGDRAGRDRERWLQRTLGDVGEHLTALRDRVMNVAKLQRHHLVLDLNAGSGLLTWEALRRVPEGGVWALARTAREAEALRELAARLPEVERPIVMQGDLDELPELLAARGDADVRFDAVIGRNALTRHPDRPAALRRIVALLRSGGRLSLAEAIPRRGQRLYRLVPLDRLDPGLAEQVVQAEEAIYADPDDPMVNWDAPELKAALEHAGLSDIHLEVVEQPTEVHITPALIERWFRSTPEGRPSYSQRLAVRLSAEQLDEVRDLFARTLTGQTVTWTSVIAYVQARRGD